MGRMKQAYYFKVQMKQPSYQRDQLHQALGREWITKEEFDAAMEALNSSGKGIEDDNLQSDT